MGKKDDKNKFDKAKMERRRKISLIGTIVLTVFVIATALSDRYNSVKKFFEKNGFGKVAILKKEVKEDGKIFIIGSRNLEYKVYLDENKNIKKIYLGRTEKFPIYNTELGDTEISQEEKIIISNAEKLVKEITKTEKVEFINNDIKKRMNSDDLNFLGGKFIDEGSYYIIEVNFNKNSSKNILNTAKYKYDLKNGEYIFIEII